jgi:hypothetical protein
MAVAARFSSVAKKSTSYARAQKYARASSSLNFSAELESIEN